MGDAPTVTATMSDVTSETSSLTNATVGRRMRIVATRLDVDVATWLAAVGLHDGEEVIILRRAVLGGPLHVRTASGGEFAIAREIADRVEVCGA